MGFGRYQVSNIAITPIAVNASHPGIVMARIDAPRINLQQVVSGLRQICAYSIIVLPAPTNPINVYIDPTV